MNHELLQVLDQLCREKGLDKSILIEAVEAAITAASKRRVGASENLEAHFNASTGEIELFALKEVVEEVIEPLTEVSIREARQDFPDAEIGDEIMIKKDIEGFGRIAAQTAKQVIVQRVREAERNMIFEHYKDRVHDVVNGIVLRNEKGNLIVDLGKAEAVLPIKEQAARDNYRRGDRIRAYVIEVRSNPQGPQIILSRTHPGLLTKLFEMEVPEIFERIVEIRGAVREAGGRAKICVVSHDRNVDPVGACVGMKGVRVQAVVRELRGENIDIIEWTNDAQSFIRNSLSPAQISRIAVFEERKGAEVIVTDDQLSLAIGRKGQNVRLAAKLTGYAIDITSETEYRTKLEEKKKKQQEDRVLVASLPCVGERLALELIQKGLDSPEAIANADQRELLAIPGIGAAKATKIQNAAREMIKAQTPVE